MSASPSQDASGESANDGVDVNRYTKRLLQGSGSVFSGSMIAKVVGFTLNLVLARGLGSVSFGRYTLGLTVMRIAQSLATLGLQNGLVRFGAPHFESGETTRVKGVFITSGGLGLLAGAGIGAVLYGSSSWLATGVFSDPEMELVLKVFACGLPFYVLTYLLSRMARALGRMRIDVLLDSLLQPALFLVLVGGVLAMGGGFTSALIAFLFSTLLAAGGGIYAIYRLFPPLFSRLSPDFHVRRLLRFSLPIVGVTLASIGLTYTDRLMLGAFSTSEAVGFYQIAARLSEQLRFVLFAVTAAFSPVISDLYQRGSLSELSHLYANTVRWILITTLPAAIILITFAPQLLRIWGAEFQAGAPLLRILALSQIVVAGVGSVGHMLQMSDHQDFVFTINTSMALLNVGLNWILIQLYGPVGAAIATATIQVLGNVIQSIGLYSFLNIHPFRRNLWKPCTAAGVGGLVAWTSYVFLSPPTQWIVGIPAVLGLYVASLFALGLAPTDQSIVQSLWRQVRSRIGV